MIPLKDDISHRSFPYVNIALIAINIAIFIFELVIGDRLSRLLYANAFVPADYTVGFTRAVERYGFLKLVYSPFVSMFVHGSVVHIAGNMLFLFVFGDNVEDRLGHVRYLFFYVLCGLVATAVHFVVNPACPLPIVGASGAIAGVLGAYLVLFPKARILTLVPLVIIFWAIRLPAFIVLPFWFITQLFSGWHSITATMSSGVAWFAHIGGFLAGGIYLWFNRRRFRPIEELPEPVAVFGDND
ncbi:rhomboid family intramembrane serine protease [bacterium]|nr:rhomboid family intramembrane serine protease [bacterium]